MATTQKALEMARELQDRLAKRGLSLTVADVAFDSSLSQPYIKIGPGVDGDGSFLIRLKPIEWPLAKDILGLDQTVYTPHKAQLAVEAGAAVDFGYAVTADLVAVMGEVMSLGCRVEMIVTPNGTGINDIIAAPQTYLDVDTYVQAVYEAHLYHKMLSSQ